MNPDFRDMLFALSGEGVEYLLVGAYALAVHGMPRATGDMDLWVRPSTENAARALAALRRFGAPLGELSEADLTRPGTVFQIGVAPRRIDFLTSIDGVEFEPAWRNRVTTVLADLEVPVLSREDFVTNKRAVGRPKDLADVAWLEGED
ncbi:MAG: nucleotidyl transferase AbiEii/AbiGii toxin family protein [Myxococcota bacterium]